MEVEIRRKIKEETNKSEMQIKIIIMLEEELKKIEQEKCRGAILRSKAKYTIEGEKCTHFFFDLEKNRGRSELIKELHTKEGEIVKGTDGIFILAERWRQCGVWQAVAWCLCYLY